MTAPSKFVSFLLAALVFTTMTGRGYAQSPAADDAKTAICHGLEMAIGGHELKTIAKDLKGPEAKTLQQKAKTSQEDSAKLLESAYQFVTSQQGGSTTQQFYTAATKYTKTLFDLAKAPMPPQTGGTSLEAQIIKVNTAVKQALEAHRLQKEARDSNSQVAQTLQQHARTMRSSAQSTLQEVLSQTSQGSPIHSLAQQGQEILKVLQQ